MLVLGVGVCGLLLELVLASGNIYTATGVLEEMSGAVVCNLA